jgi:hypothetical protein
VAGTALVVVGPAPAVVVGDLAVVIAAIDPVPTMPVVVLESLTVVTAALVPEPLTPVVVAAGFTVVLATIAEVIKGFGNVGVTLAVATVG